MTDTNSPQDKDGMNPKVALKLWRGAEKENGDFGFVVKMKPLDWD